MILKAAAVQLSAGPDKFANLAKVLRLAGRACDAGARLVTLPENFLFRGTDRQFTNIPEALDGPSIGALRELAGRRGVHLLAGSFAESVPGSKKTYNTSCLIDPAGNIQSVYRKIHLFDVDLPGRKIRESERCLPGKKPVLGNIRTSGGAAIRCGLSVCFDLRFSDLYREYAQLGAKILFVPSNFTRVTGRDHWEPLLRARAIESQCFVLAPGQSGVGSQGVLSHGNSMILDPWGRILVKASGAGEAMITADLNFSDLDRVRRNLPVLNLL